MGFDTHPFKVFTLFQYPGDDIGYRWKCDSCGGYSTLVFHGEQFIQAVHEDFKLHVLIEHNIKPEDVANWSLGV